MIISHILTIFICSVDSDYVYNYDYDSDYYSEIVFEFNDEGPVYGPNGLLELDPDNVGGCRGESRPVFATCKNNCPGGELSVLSYFSSDKLDISLHLKKYISRHQQV